MLRSTLLLLVLLSASLAAADPPVSEVDRAQQLIYDGQIDEGMALLKREADAGDLDAQMWLGVMHEKLGDREEAERWLKPAAEAGHAGAQFRLAGLYARDPARQDLSLEWLRKSAAQDYPQAVMAQQALAAMPEPPPAKDGVVDSGAYADYLSSILKAQVGNRADALACYRLTPATFAPVLQSAAAQCRAEASTRFPDGIRNEADAEGLQQSHPICMRDRMLAAAGIGQEELMQCAKQLAASPAQ